MAPRRKNSRCSLLLLLVLLPGQVLTTGCERPRDQQARSASPPEGMHKPAAPKISKGPARPANAPSPEWVAKAREEMPERGLAGKCGNYLLFTDVREPSLLTACERLASQLDRTYESRSLEAEFEAWVLS